MKTSLEDWFYIVDGCGSSAIKQNDCYGISQSLKLFLRLLFIVYINIKNDNIQSRWKSWRMRNKLTCLKWIFHVLFTSNLLRTTKSMYVNSFRSLVSASIHHFHYTFSFFQKTNKQVESCFESTNHSIINMMNIFSNILTNVKQNDKMYDDYTAFKIQHSTQLCMIQNADL